MSSFTVGGSPGDVGSGGRRSDRPVRHVVVSFTHDDHDLAGEAIHEDLRGRSSHRTWSAPIRVVVNAVTFRSIVIEPPNRAPSQIGQFVHQTVVGSAAQTTVLGRG